MNTSNEIEDVEDRIFTDLKERVERDCKQFTSLYNLSKRDGILQRAVIAQDFQREVVEKSRFRLYLSKEIINSSPIPMLMLFHKSFGFIPKEFDSYHTAFDFEDGSAPIKFYHDNLLSEWIDKFYNKGRRSVDPIVVYMNAWENELSLDTSFINKKRNRSLQTELDAICPYCTGYDVRHEGSDDGVHWNGWRPLFSCGDCRETWEGGIDGYPYTIFAKNKSLFNFTLEEHYPPIVEDEGWKFEF